MMEIRVFNHDDYIKYRKEIRKLLLDSYMSNFDISSKYGNQIVDKKIIQLGEYINKGNAMLIGALENDSLAGIIWIHIHEYFDEIRLHINQIIVKQCYRGKGLGKMLMSESENIAIKLEVDSIDLFVTEENLEALKMYEKLGFKTERRYLKKDL